MAPKRNGKPGKSWDVYVFRFISKAILDILLIIHKVIHSCRVTDGYNVVAVILGKERVEDDGDDGKVINVSLHANCWALQSKVYTLSELLNVWGDFKIRKSRLFSFSLFEVVTSVPISKLEEEGEGPIQVSIASSVKEKRKTDDSDLQSINAPISVLIAAEEIIDVQGSADQFVGRVFGNHWFWKGLRIDSISSYGKSGIEKAVDKNK